MEWKRKAFFSFVEVFYDSAWNQELKAKVIADYIPYLFHYQKDLGDGCDNQCFWVTFSAGVSY